MLGTHFRCSALQGRPVLDRRIGRLNGLHQEFAMLKQLAFALAATVALAGPALAQTATTTKSTTTSTAPNANGTTGQFFTQEQAGQWRASKLRGLNVYNNNDEKIGDIDELLVDRTGKV